MISISDLIIWLRRGCQPIEKDWEIFLCCSKKKGKIIFTLLEEITWCWLLGIISCPAININKNSSHSSTSRGSDNGGCGHFSASRQTWKSTIYVLGTASSENLPDLFYFPKQTLRYMPILSLFYRWRYWS